VSSRHKPVEHTEQRSRTSGTPTPSPRRMRQTTNVPVEGVASPKRAPENAPVRPSPVRPKSAARCPAPGDRGRAQSVSPPRILGHRSTGSAASRSPNRCDLAMARSRRRSADMARSMGAMATHPCWRDHRPTECWGERASAWGSFRRPEHLVVSPYDVDGKPVPLSRPTGVMPCVLGSTSCRSQKRMYEKPGPSSGRGPDVSSPAPSHSSLPPRQSNKAKAGPCTTQSNSTPESRAMYVAPSGASHIRRSSRLPGRAPCAHVY
jgi:hypothetical protein